MDQQSIKAIEKQLEKELEQEYEGRPRHLRRLITYEKIDKGLINLFVDSDDKESEIPNLKLLETEKPLKSIYVGNVQPDKKIFSSFCLMKLIQNQQARLQRVLIIGEKKSDAEEWKDQLKSFIHGQVRRTQTQGKGKNNKDSKKQETDTVEIKNPEEILRHFLSDPQRFKSKIGLKKEIAPLLGVSYYNELSFDLEKIEEASEYEMKAEFIRFLQQQVANQNFTLFDLVVVDFKILPQSKRKDDKNRLEFIRQLKQNSKNVLIIASEAIEKDQIQTLLKVLDVPLKTLISSSSNLILISDLSLLDRNQIIINGDREKNCRYIRSFIEDALLEPEIAKNQFERGDSDSTICKLSFTSEEIQGKIKEFIEKYHIKSKYLLYSPTLLSSQAEATCIFNIKQISQVKERYELIDSNHPVILWIKEQFDQQSSLLKRRSAIQLTLHKAKEAKSSIQKGQYFYCIVCSSVNGIIEKHALQYQLYDLSKKINFTPEESENIIEKAAFEGEFFPNAKNNVKRLEGLADFFEKCKNESHSSSTEEKKFLHKQQKKQLQDEKEKVINEIEGNIKRISEILPDPINALLKGVEETMKYIFNITYDKKDKELNEVMESTNAENAIIGVGLIFVEEE